jgi:cytoskeleton protein RodZ
MMDERREPMEICTAPSAGAILREARERRNLSVDEVAARLRLSVVQVRAIEADNYAALPGPAFVRGFFRNYAKLVQLDPNSILRLLDAAGFDASMLHSIKGELSVPSQNIRFSPETRGDNWMLIVGTLILAGVAIVGGAAWRWEQAISDFGQKLARVISHEPAARAPNPPPRPAPSAAVPSTAAAPPIAETPQAVERSNPTAASAEPAPPAEPVKSLETPPAAPAETTPAAAESAQQQRLKFTFEKESWVEIRDKKGKRIYSKLNPGGTTEEVSADPPVSLVIGNAAHVKLSYGDREIDLARYTKGTIARLSLEN